MKTFKCLEAIEKEDVVNMEFDNLRVLVVEVNKETEVEKMRQFLLDILDMRDDQIDSAGSRIIPWPKDIK